MRYYERDSFKREKQLQIIEREKIRGKIIVIFAYSLESIFHITTADSFTVGSDWFLDSLFYVRDTSIFGWIRKKISLERDKCFTLSVLYFGVLSSCFYCTNWGFVLIWLFVACFSALVGGYLVSSLIIVELFLWSGWPVIFTLPLRGFPR